MVTELLERTVIQMCKDDSLAYLISPNLPDGKVRIPVRITGAVIYFTIIDLEMGTLSISARDFVGFSEDQVACATTMCNELNLRGPGKFYIDTIDEDRCVSYVLDFPANETAGPSEFDAAFELAVDAMERFHPVIMRVRWANVTFEQALESEYGKPGLSNEELDKLFGQTGQDEIDEDIDPEG